MTKLDNRFKHHHASMEVFLNQTIITYRKPNSVEYLLRYTFDKELSTLSITGDFGACVAINVSNLGDPHLFYRDCVNDAGYFASKIRTSEYPISYYDPLDACDYLKEQLPMLHDTELGILIDEFDEDNQLHPWFGLITDANWTHFDYIVDQINESLMTNNDCVEQIDPYDLLDILEATPKTQSPYIQLYLDVFKAAYEELFPENIKTRL